MHADVKHRLITTTRTRYTDRLRALLSRPSLDAEEARDGMVDCYVATYFGGLERGRSGYFGIDASASQIERVAKALIRSRLRAAGGSYEHPTIGELDRVRVEVDEELQLEDLPGDLRELHDQLCRQLITKAEESHGARSGVIERTSAHEYLRPPSPEKEVSRGLRDSLSTYLAFAAENVRAGASLDDIGEFEKKIARLIATLRDFS